MATGTVKKHIGIYNDKSEFEQDRDNGVLVAPYVAYLREGTGYRLYHSSDSNLERCETNLEAGKLGENDDIQVTPIGSAQCTVKYSPVVFYCTYED